MEKENGRSEYLDFLKAILIITVLLGHCIQYGGGYEDNSFFDNKLFKFIYSFHMPLFMLISGYLFSESVKKGNFFVCYKKEI